MVSESVRLPAQSLSSAWMMIPFAPQAYGTLRPLLAAGSGRSPAAPEAPPSGTVFLYRSAGISPISGPDAVKGLPTE